VPPARGRRARRTAEVAASIRRVARAARSVAAVRAALRDRLAGRRRSVVRVSLASDGDARDRSWWRMLRARLGFSFEVLRSWRPTVALGSRRHRPGLIASTSQRGSRQRAPISLSTVVRSFRGGVCYRRVPISNNFVPGRADRPFSCGNASTFASMGRAIGTVTNVTPWEAVAVLGWWCLILAAPVMLLRRRRRRRGQPSGHRRLNDGEGRTTAVAASPARPATTSEAPRLSSGTIEPLCRYVDFHRRLRHAVSELEETPRTGEGKPPSTASTLGRSSSWR
jgi:hypothetical protein